MHLSVCLFSDQSSQLILCLERIYIFLNLDCQALVWLSSLGLWPRLDNYQTLAGQSRSWKMKILSRQSNFAIELCHLWAVLQMQHRTFILSYTPRPHHWTKVLFSLFDLILVSQQTNRHGWLTIQRRVDFYSIMVILGPWNQVRNVSFFRNCSPRGYH